MLLLIGLIALSPLEFSRKRGSVMSHLLFVVVIDAVSSEIMNRFLKFCMQTILF